MSIKTWRARLKPEYQGIATMAVRFMQDEIDELRAALQGRDAEIETLKAEVDLYRSACDRRDAEIERLKQGAHEDGMLRVRYGKQFDAQRKVLEQALDALQLCAKTVSNDQIYKRDKAITAIQEVLK